MVLDMKETLQHLQEYGYVVLHNYWSKEVCEDAINELKTLPKMAFESGQGGDLRCQHSNRYLKSANNFLNDSFIQSIANEYSTCSRADRVVGGIVSYQDGVVTDSGGGWHVDSEAPAQLKSFIYLDDVSEKNGPFVFVQKSRELVNSLDKHSNLRITDELVKDNVNDEDIIEITGKAGTCILADSTYLHRGKQISEGTRYTFTTYFYEV